MALLDPQWGKGTEELYRWLQQSLWEARAAGPASVEKHEKERYVPRWMQNEARSASRSDT